MEVTQGWNTYVVLPSLCIISSTVSDGAMGTTFDVFVQQKATDDIYTVVAHAEDKAANEISEKKSSLERTKSALEKEDHEYHEAERRRREREAEEARHRANAARAGK